MPKKLFELRFVSPKKGRPRTGSFQIDYVEPKTPNIR
jgi:hypothetical protein